MASDLNNPVQPCAKGQNNEQEEQKKTDKWLKIKIKNKNGDPIENVRIELEHKDEYAVMTTDENGEVKKENIEDGKYKMLADWRTIIDFNIPLSQVLILE